MDVEAEEVDQLARGVDLGLLDGLGLAEHRGGVEGVPPRAREQVRGAQEDGGALVEREVLPGRCGVLGGLDGLGHVLAGGLGRDAEDVVVVVGLDDLDPVAARHALLAADGGGELVPDALELGDPAAQRLAVGAARFV